MKALITCAGYASRLWPLTKDTPKPLLNVKDKPILQHIIGKVLQIPKVDGIIIVTNDKFYPHFESWLNSNSFEVPVKILNDKTVDNDSRLGQVGDIKFAVDAEAIEDDLLVIAGDNLFNFSLLPAYEKFVATSCVVNPLWESKSYKAARESGSVVLNESSGIFAEFSEKSPNPKSTLLSLGIYFFPKEKTQLIHKYLGESNNPDKMGYFLTWLMGHDEIHSHVYEQAWFDIGWIEALEKARQEFEI